MDVAAILGAVARGWYTAKALSARTYVDVMCLFILWACLMWVYESKPVSSTDYTGLDCDY